MLVHDKHSGKYLTPGTFLAGTILSPADMSFIDPSSTLNQTTVKVGNNIVVSSPLEPVIFRGINYAETAQLGERAGSAYFPNGYYGLVEPGKALWGGVPDISQVRGISGSIKRFSLGKSRLRYKASANQAASCDPPCASGGECGLEGFKAVCRCREGWSGGACDVCAKGFYGAECKGE